MGKREWVIAWKSSISGRWRTLDGARFQRQEFAEYVAEQMQKDYGDEYKALRVSDGKPGPVG